MPDPAAKRLENRVVLVSGASRGIGRALARMAAGEGAHVVAVARTVGGLEELDDEIKAAGGSATLVPLDLTDMAGIDRLGGAVAERWGRLDGLVANAAMLGVLAPVGHIEAKVFEQTIAVNVTATWRLIRATDPLLRRSDAGRALVVSSSVAHSCKAFWSLYAASKAACEALVRSWAFETETLPLRVNSADPGATRTAMRKQAMPGEDPLTLPGAEDVAARLLPLLFPDVTETGGLFNVRENRFTAYHKPS